jgi:hypothetical protein
MISKVELPGEILSPGCFIFSDTLLEGIGYNLNVQMGMPIWTCCMIKGNL